MSESAQGRRGADVPDGRGRTGLDQVGRDLDRNPNVVVENVILLQSAALNLFAD